MFCIFTDLEAANVQTFTGTLGGAAPPVISSAGDRPFSVNGDTFVNAAAALQRSCSVSSLTRSSNMLLTNSRSKTTHAPMPSTLAVSRAKLSVIATPKRLPAMPLPQPRKPVLLLTLDPAPIPLSFSPLVSMAARKTLSSLLMRANSTTEAR